MTVCGFQHLGDGGYVWADTESYLHDEPLPKPVIKLHSSAGGLVGIGTGYTSFCENFGEYVETLGYTSYFAAKACLPKFLRDISDEFRQIRQESGKTYIPDTIVCLVGSTASGLRGTVFAARSGFEPHECESWSSPFVGKPIKSASDVLETAQSQIRFVQKRSPGATGKDLTIAWLEGSTVSKASVPLLIGDEISPRQDVPPPYALLSPAHQAFAVREARAELMRQYWFGDCR